MGKPADLRRSPHGYRGRVRSGCLTCRSRKVKCDEERPVCNNCTRLQRQCVYKPKKSQLALIRGTNNDNAALDQPPPDVVADRSSGPPEILEVYPSPPVEQPSGLGVLERSEASNTNQEPFQHPDVSIIDVTRRLEKVLQDRKENSLTPHAAHADRDSPATLISRDIELTTTMDLLAAHGKSFQHSSSFFLETVDCPGITAYDSVNWQLMKHHAVEVGRSCAAVSSSIDAVSALYKAQLYALPVSRAMSVYHSAKAAFQQVLGNDSHNFSDTLVSAFLLCLFELIYSGDISPVLKEPSEIFLERLSDWAQRHSTHSNLCIRLVAWFRILHRITLRGGGMGLIANNVCELLPSYSGAIPNLEVPASYHPDVSMHLYQVLSAPVFDFYYRLQMLSGEIAHLTHYHRSRITGADQEEVVQTIAVIRSRLHELWDSRCVTQRQTPEDLSSQLAPKIASRIISLIGICDAAYHAEIVEIDRVLGDPVAKWTDSRESIQSIREIIDADWGRQGEAAGRKISPGYLRPLFLYAIESMDPEQNQWAVGRISQIQSPIYRSDFFAEFGKALSDAQVRKERRVTSKYFCIWYFGVPPPFM
ncbi:hypothetical protein GQ53DRAFT_720543 [Thozetella sp. PMI_491]|nr:hypothetical protein GQ53DRAFT_720543 [Thozetella sp. PMI_491]